MLISLLLRCKSAQVHLDLLGVLDIRWRVGLHSKQSVVQNIPKFIEKQPKIRVLRSTGYCKLR